jgi:hypothetical protein
MEFDKRRKREDDEESLQIGYQGRTDSISSSATGSETVLSEAEKAEEQELEREIAEEKKPKKPVARIVPAFIDLILFLAQLAVFGGFLYMTFWGGDVNKPDCIADAYSQKPLSITPDDNTVGANVTVRFRQAIRFGFAMSSLNITRSVLAQIALKFKSWLLLYASYLLFAVNFTLVLILFIFMNLWRFNNSGKVCSGDFVTAADKLDPNWANYYLV